MPSTTSTKLSGMFAVEGADENLLWLERTVGLRAPKTSRGRLVLVVADDPPTAP
jgi:hypothetical protein